MMNPEKRIRKDPNKACCYEFRKHQRFKKIQNIPGKNTCYVQRIKNQKDIRLLIRDIESWKTMEQYLQNCEKEILGPYPASLSKVQR